jgi:hypothetical protein
MDLNRFVNRRSRRNFRYGTVGIFLFGLGTIAVYQTHRPTVSPPKDPAARHEVAVAARRTAGAPLPPA